MLLTVYASLHPLEGWRNSGAGAFDYLLASLPRMRGRFDIAVNVLGYAPFGLLCVAALHPRVKGFAAFAIAVLGAAALSIGLEALQTYLPTRHASNMDVLANLAGGALGAAIGVRLAPWLLDHGPLKRMRAHIFLPGIGIDLGLALIALWLFIQLNPTTLLFGAGDLRDLLVTAAGRQRAPEFFVSIEAVTAVANLVAMALLLSALIVPRQPVRMVFLGLVAAALVVKAIAFALTRDDAFVWLTLGAQEGLGAGLALALLAVALPRTARLALASVLIMAATVFVNLAPPNPYFAATLKVWHQGHFLNFNGLTRLVSAAWPFLALAYLIFLAAKGGRKVDE